MKKKLYVLLAALALILALFAGMLIGAKATRDNAVLVVDEADRYIVSYRYGGYWRNQEYAK